VKIQYTVALSMLAGVALGAVAIQGLHAQATPPSYVVTEIEEVTDAAAFSAVTSRPQGDANARIQQAGGRYITRTDKITALDGNPPKRMIMIAFDSPEKAKAFNEIPTQKEINASRTKNTKSRSFIVQGM
jgi:uncharacterized protein (DUF1330 family)